MTVVAQLHQNLPGALVMALAGPILGHLVATFAEDLLLNLSSSLPAGSSVQGQQSLNPFCVILAATTVMLLLVGLTFGATDISLIVDLFGAVLIVLAAVDQLSGFLPNLLTIPLLIFGLEMNAWHLFTSFTDACVGAAAGFLTIIAASAICRLQKGQAGFGAGDAKMLAAIGAWVGLQGVLLTAALAVFLASLSLFASGWRSTTLRPEDTHYSLSPQRQAFGPFLCAAGILALLITATLPVL
ncbi:A24 family peptidase [Bordetella sp. FB-8]|uniref:prepilin peptidase n=1 Tax=Bordetella sp. FB-8 TaxID=1159870 RepID=UPI00035FB7BE|nr:A24 family peptidase [Bordetella sp. FB-8]